MSLLTSLISAWEMDEASGNRADSHGSNTLTDNNTVTSGTGLVHGTVAQFTRANSEYLSHADNTDLSTGDIDFTFEAWVNFDSIGSYIIVGKDTDTGRDYTLDYINNSSGFRFYINGGTALVNSNVTASTGTWYHVVGWHDSVADEVGIAINAGTASTASTGGTAPNDTGTEFNIGSRRYPGNNDYFDGRIGPVRFWKRVLTSGERTTLYNGGSGLAYSSFGGGGGTSAGEAFAGVYSPAIMPIRRTEMVAF